MNDKITNENADNVAKALVDYFVTKRGGGTTLTKVSTKKVLPAQKKKDPFKKKDDTDTASGSNHPDNTVHKDRFSKGI